jgi:flagellin
MSSIFAANQSSINATNLQKSMEKLSSGEKINRAADNSANLSISEKMRSQIRGLNQAGQNIQNGISFVQTTEGYMNETTDILQRIRELAVQSANGIYSDEDRSMMQVEISQLVAEVDRIASTAQFNGYNMLTGRFEENGLKLQVGANMDQSVEVKIDRLTAEHLGLKGQENTISVLDQDSANMTISTVDEALKKVNKNRSDLGAMQNRMELALKGNNIAKENMIASESRIRDTDYASEMVEFTKNSILNQASAAMLSQANSQHAMALKLLS